MKLLAPADVHAAAVRRLGLDSSAVDLTSIEALAASLRRAAGFFCPCGPTTLKRAVLRSLDGLVEHNSELVSSVDNTLAALVGFGDLIEQRELTDAGRAATLLYPAFPSFVVTGDTSVMIIGISPEHISPLTEDLEGRLEYRIHFRRLTAAPGEDLRATLRSLGLFELTFETWLKTPPPSTAARMLQKFDELLDRAGPSGEIPDLVVIDPELPVRYYKGRWRDAGALTGRFVGRRPQAYGSDLWCYIEVRAGVPLRFVDLPLRGSRVRGCDEAWHLQMAIDAQRNVPQQFRLRRGPLNSQLIDLFSPIPMWAQRALDASGEPAASTGALFSYRATHNVEKVVDLLKNALWLSPIAEPV
jgi:hypothetical protein